MGRYNLPTVSSLAPGDYVRVVTSPGTAPRDKFIPASALAAGGGSTLGGVATLDFPATGPGQYSDLTVTVTGAAAGDPVSLGPPPPPPGCSYSAFVSAPDTVTVRFTNSDPLGTYDPAAGEFTVTVHH